MPRKKTKTHSRNIPKIIRVNEVDVRRKRISVLFNNGSDRIIDFQTNITQVWKSRRTDPEYALLSASVFGRVRLVDFTLVWDWVDPSGASLQYAIGPDTLYEISEPDEQRNISIGGIFKTARLRARKTQEEVAASCGTSRTYITRLENGQQDIELMTLKKLIEGGLNKRLKISIV
jgi:DNA-binding XRE family transcriptional regulator